ncbi:MAG: FAD-binding protein, partial [Actinomycetota bacterium]|nr:FAD-binding protein [Actinomycetota bacterium]
SWGLPPTGLDLIVDTSRMAAVLAHAAGDLVVTTQAGLRMVDLQKQLGAHRQRLALDGSDTLAGTIGGTSPPQRRVHCVTGSARCAICSSASPWCSPTAPSRAPAGQW